MVANKRELYCKQDGQGGKTRKTRRQRLLFFFFKLSIDFIELNTPEMFGRVLVSVNSSKNSKWFGFFFVWGFLLFSIASSELKGTAKS